MKKNNSNKKQSIKAKKTKDFDKLRVEHDYDKDNKKKILSKNEKIINRFIFVIIVLSTALIGSLFYNFTGGFKFSEKYNSEISIGEDAKIVMNDSYLPSAMAIDVEGSVLVNDRIYQNISIKLPDLDLQNYELRVQIWLGENKTHVEIYGFETWTKVQNYYVYNNQISRLNTIGLCEAIKIISDNQLNHTLTYSMVVVCSLHEKNI